MFKGNWILHFVKIDATWSSAARPVIRSFRKLFTSCSVSAIRARIKKICVVNDSNFFWFSMQPLQLGTATFSIGVFWNEEESVPLISSNRCSIVTSKGSSASSRRSSKYSSLKESMFCVDLSKCSISSPESSLLQNDFGIIRLRLLRGSSDCRSLVSSASFAFSLALRYVSGSTY